VNRLRIGNPPGKRWSMLWICRPSDVFGKGPPIYAFSGGLRFGSTWTVLVLRDPMFVDTAYVTYHLCLVLLCSTLVFILEYATCWSDQVIYLYSCWFVPLRAFWTLQHFRLWTRRCTGRASDLFCFGFGRLKTLEDAWRPKTRVPIPLSEPSRQVQHGSAPICFIMFRCRHCPARITAWSTAST
jgi:hypothetical protein